MFPQVMAVFPAQQSFYPQEFPQAVHKLGAVVHRLSTGAANSWVGGRPKAGYRCWRSTLGCEISDDLGRFRIAISEADGRERRFGIWQRGYLAAAGFGTADNGSGSATKTVGAG